MLLLLALSLSHGNLVRAQVNTSPNFIPRLLRGNNSWTGTNVFLHNAFTEVPGGQFGANPQLYLQSISDLFVYSQDAILPFQASIVQTGANGFNFPTAVSGFSQLNYTGYLVFGGNFIAEQFTTGAGLGTEIDANNWYGAPTNTFPPDYSVSGLVTKVYPVGQQTMCGGNFDCYFAYGAGQNLGVGSGGQWLAAFYSWAAAVKTYGIFIDGTWTQGPQFPFYGRYRTGGVGMVLQTMDTYTGAKVALQVEDAGANIKGLLYEDGSSYQKPLLISALQTCNAGATGLKAFISDTVATAVPTYHGVVAGGGAQTAISPVYCDGTNWRFD